LTAAVVSITAVLVLHKTTAETQCRRDCHTLLSPDPAGMPPTLNSAVSCCAPFTLLERTLRWSELHSMLTESMRTIASRNLTGTIAAAVECLLRVPHCASRGAPRGYRTAAAPRLRGGCGQPWLQRQRHSQSRIAQQLNSCTVLRTVVLSSPHYNGMHHGFPIHQYHCSTHVPSALRCLSICCCSAATGRWSDKQRAAHSGDSRMIPMLRSHVKFTW
jgi:hypothetical protein